MSNIFAIDPGSVRSAYVVVDENLKPLNFGIIENKELLEIIINFKHCDFAIEMIASYGMPVGKEVFDTCVWIGRFYQVISMFNKNPTFIYRMDEKMAICHNTRARDSNIRQALIDRFGIVGTKKNKGWFYGFKKDIWQAYAVAVTYHDKRLENGYGKRKNGTIERN